MSRRGTRTKTWIVQRIFEPDRLSADRLVTVYEKLVPQPIRVPPKESVPISTPDNGQAKPGVHYEA
jgi:hypothetical protein